VGNGARDVHYFRPLLCHSFIINNQSSHTDILGSGETRLEEEHVGLFPCVRVNTADGTREAKSRCPHLGGSVRGSIVVVVPRSRVSGAGTCVGEISSLFRGLDQYRGGEASEGRREKCLLEAGISRSIQQYSYCRSGSPDSPTSGNERRPGGDMRGSLLKCLSTGRRNYRHVTRYPLQR